MQKISQQNTQHQTSNHVKKHKKEKIFGIVKPCEKTKEDDEEKLKRDHHWNVERRSPKLASKTTHFYLKGLMLLMNMRKV